MINSTLPLLSDPADPRDVIVWLRSLTKCIGPGFHPDTPAAEYVSLKTETPTFTPEEAQRIDADMNRAFDILDGTGRDPYDVAIKVQRRLLGFARD